MTLGYAPSIGETFTIVANDNSDAIVGTFAGLGEGASFLVGTQTFKISYVGGTGNDVVITAIATPTIRYVDDAWSGFNPGDPITDADPVASGNQPATFGTTAFASLQAAITAAAANDTIVINSGTYAESVTVNKVLNLTFQEAASTVGSLTVAADSTGSVITLNATLTIGDATNATIGANITGTGGLVKAGTGTLTLLNGANSFLGGLTVNAGQIVVGATGAIPSRVVLPSLANDTATTIAAGATLTLNGFSVTLGSLTGAGTLENASATTATVTVGSLNASTTFSGLIQNGTGAGLLNLVKSGTGTHSLTGTANTYTGTTTISGGVLEVSAIANGGVVSSIGQSTSGATNLVLAGGTLRFTPTATTATSDRNLTLTAASTIDVLDPASTVTFGGTIVGGTSALTKAGAGTLAFTNILAFGSANSATTYGSITTGSISVTGGDLQVVDLRLSAGTRTGGTRLLTINTGATLTASGTVALDPSSSAYSTIITGPGKLKLRNSSSSKTTPSLTYDFGPSGGDGTPFGAIITATIDVGSGVTQWISGKTNRNDVGRYSGDLRFNAGFVGSANVQFVGLNQNSSHNMHFVLNADNSAFTGGWLLANADLALTAANAVTVANAFTFNSQVDAATNNRASLFFFGRSQSIGSLNDTSASGTTAFIRNGALSATNGGTNTNNSASSTVLGVNSDVTLTITQSSNGSFAGAFQDGPNDTAAGASGTYRTLSVIKSGQNLLTLSGTSAITGSLTVNDGLLSNNGSYTATGGISVASVGSLAGIGTFVGAVTLTGTISPAGATATGILATGALTFGVGGKLTVQINGVTVGSSYDQVNVTGNVDLTNAILDVSSILDAQITPGTSLVLVQTSGTLTGKFQTTTGTILNDGDTITVASVNFTVNYTSTTATLTRQSPGTVYVDDNWAGFNDGDSITDADPVASGNQPAVFGTTAFASINAAINATTTLSFTTLIINSSTYPEAVVISKPVVLTFQEAASSIGSIANDANNFVSTINLNVPVTIGSDNSSTSYSGTFLGSGTLIKAGTGTLTVSGINGQTGGTTVAAGTLIVGNVNALNSSSANRQCR